MVKAHEDSSKALADQDSTTIVSYEGDAQVGGKVASVGQRLLAVQPRRSYASAWKESPHRFRLERKHKMSQPERIWKP
jgi:hypothetical protein